MPRIRNSLELHKAMIWAFSASLIFCNAANAQNGVEYYWTGAGQTSLWSDNDNWQPNTGHPNEPDDFAIFGDAVADPIMVTFNESVSYGAIVLSNENINVVFDLQGHTSTVGNTKSSLTTAANDQSGNLKITNGEFNDTRYSGISSGYFGTCLGSRCTGKMVIDGTGSVLRSANSFDLCRFSGSYGYLHLLNGATAYLDGLRPQNNGFGEVLIDDSTLYLGSSSTLNLAHKTGMQSHIIARGPKARWYRLSANNKRSIKIGAGGDGKGSITVSDGARIVNGISVIYMGITANATGIVTIEGEGSTIGGTADEDGMLNNVIVGGDTLGTMAEPPAVTGAGAINLLDGGGLIGWRGDKQSYFFIGEGSRINLRDGYIAWCIEENENRDSPFYFSPDSFLSVELTAQTAAITENRPLIRSGANAAGNEGENIITEAILELSLAENYVHHEWSEITLFRYNGTLVGEFADLGEGQEIFLDDHRFKIHYGTRDDSAITLQVCGPRGTALMIR